MNKKIKFIIITILILTTNIVKAENLVTYPEQIKISTEDVPATTQIEESLNSNGYYHTVSPIYEFYDENNLYNIIYASDKQIFTLPTDHNLKVHWLKINNNNVVFNKELNHTAELFGNAIYKDGYLYVIYGRSALYKEDSLNINTIEVVKYDSNGNIIGNLPLKGKDTYNNFVTQSQAGTRVPFSYANPSNCDVAIKDNILVMYFGRLSYSIHQSSLFLAIDTNTMTLKTEGVWAGLQSQVYASHSMDQRIIVDRDKNIITIDMGDAGPRGFNVNKIKFIGENSAYQYKFEPFNFRESAYTGYYYNNTYASMGNIIELNDGYIFISASDKELSKSFLNTNYGNPWNIFVQKYKHNFEEVKTQKEYYNFSATEEENKNMQMFTNEEIRYNQGERSTNDYTKIHLRTNQNNYGVKWLTDFDYDCTIDNIRAIKIDNERILIIYEVTPVRNTKDVSPQALFEQREIYYIIIDKDGNKITKPIKVANVEMSTNIHYQYKDGYIYWTTANGKDKSLTINKLKAYDYKDIGDIPINKISISGNYTITKGGKTTLKVSYYPENTNERKKVTWTSSNENIATVDEFGEVRGLHGGKVTITAKTSKGISSKYEVIINSFEVNTKEITLQKGNTFKIEILEKYSYGEEIPDNKISYESKDTSVATVDNLGNVSALKEGNTNIIIKENGYQKKTIPLKVINYLKGDTNKNGKIEFADVIIALRQFLKIEETLTEDINITDMNNNGKLEFADVISILRLYLGIK